MCARIFYLILAAVFLFVVVTVAAFRYLVWWQAILASAATFVLLVFGAKLLIKSFIGNLGNLAKGLFEMKSKALRGATIQVHSVRPTEVPADVLAGFEEAKQSEDEDDGPEEKPADPRDLAWYEIEVTVFPSATPSGPMTHWDIDDLRVVPLDAKPMSMSDGDEEDDDHPESGLHGLTVVVDGDPQEPEGPKFAGPQRIRFAAGLPKTVREAKFQYYFENFGHIPLTAALPR